MKHLYYFYGFLHSFFGVKVSADLGERLGKENAIYFMNGYFEKPIDFPREGSKEVTKQNK